MRKKSLKIPKRSSESVYHRQHNGQKKVHKVKQRYTKHIKLKIE